MIDMNHKWAKPVTVVALVLAAILAGGPTLDALIRLFFVQLVPAP